MKILADRDMASLQRLRSSSWRWLIALAFFCGVGMVVLAGTVRDRCSDSDPACIFHSYTLVHTAGPGVLAFVGAPALISLVLAGLLRIKVTRRSARAGRAAWIFASLSCVVCFVGVAVEGFLMLLEAVLTLLAVAATPFPPDPDDPLLRPGGWRVRRPPATY